MHVIADLRHARTIEGGRLRRVVMTIDSFDVSPRRLWLSSVWRPTELAEWRVDTRCTVGVPIVGGDVVAASDAAWAIFSARRREGTS